MKVLMVHPRTGHYGGAELVVVRLANYLVQHGHEVAYLTTGFPPGMKDQMAGVQLINVGIEHLKNKFSDTFDLWDGVPQYATDYDVVNYHNFPATLGHHQVNTPGVWLCNEPPELFTSWWRKPIEAYNRRLVRKHIRNVVVADEYNRDRFQELYGVNAHIIPYGIDHDFFAKGEDVPHDRFTVVQVGTVSFYKNQMASIRAVEALKDQIPGIQLIIAGKICDQYGMEAHQYVLDRGLENTVFFTGNLAREGVRDLYKKSDVVIHPVKPQGGWLTPFEAISAGRPVITSNEITCRQLLEKYNLAYVAEDYFQAIEFLYQRIQAGNYVQGWGSDWVRNNLSWDQFGQKWETLLSAVAKK